MSNYNSISRRPWGIAVVVIAALIFTGVVLVINCGDGNCLSQQAEPANSKSSTPAVSMPTIESGEKVVISFYTSDTKANWIIDVTSDFNESQRTISSGKIINVEVETGDSGDLKDELLAGTIQPTVFSPGEMSWVNEANAVWQQHYNKALVSGDCPPTVIAGIGFGMWKPMAEAMGWPDKPIGWKEIMALANDPNGWGRYGHPEWGQFKFGHTHPLESNTGRLAIISLAYWALGRTDGLTPEMVKSEKVTSALQQLELHTNHYGGSTRELFARMVEFGPAYLHAGTTSETNLLITNAVNKENKAMWSPLVFIPPAEGTFWSDNPYCILEGDWVTAEQREAAEVFKQYLLDENQQLIAMQEHGLRPTNPSVALGPLIDVDSGTDPRKTQKNIPTLATVSGDVAQAVDDVFIAAKKKAIIVVVLDTSSSMQGDKIKAAAGATVEFLKTLRKDRDDEIHVFAFGSQVYEVTPGGRVGDVVEELGSKTGGLFAEGGTALYDALCTAASYARQRQADYQSAGEPRLAGIVLLSDGIDTSSSEYTESDVFNFCLSRAEDAEPLPVYAIAYGTDADKNLLTRFANHTHGKFYEADEANIREVYNKIAYEQ